MKGLIINADDLGSDIARNEGIFRALDAGIVTSASILANGPAFDDAIRRMSLTLGHNASFGVHLNISQGTSVSRGLEILADENNLFPGKAKTLSLFSGHVSDPLREEIEREVTSQIEKLLNAGIDITHIDSHHHVHILPAVAPIVMKAAQKYHIRRMRVPEEPSGTLRSLPSDPAITEEAEFFSRFARQVRPLLTAWGIIASDHFLGLYMKGRLSPAVLAEVAENLNDGITELMVHPGTACAADPSNPFSLFSTAERQIELAALLDDGFHAILEKKKIKLLSYCEALN
ncbi:MAG: hypothetical protein C0399_08905 [Syntrophus sp. (in: bacteria)]|nr:hypothetical protein [Syntrophus sp. (in: bacteria)]